MFFALDENTEGQNRKKRSIRISSEMPGIGVDGIDPISFAFDWVGNNMYWIDSSYGKPVIMISDIRGLARKKIVTKILYNPQTLALDPIRG